jgi:hypothetical protein
MTRHIVVRCALVVLPFLAARAASAQSPSSRTVTDAGSLLTGGSAGFTHSSGSGGVGSSTTVGLSPNLLIFVRRNLALGGRVDVDYTSFKNGHRATAGVGPAARLYFGGGASKLLPYVEGSIGYSHLSSTQDVVTAGVSREVSSSATSWSPEGVLGVTAMFSRQVGLSAEAFVNRISFDEEDDLIGLDNPKITSYGVRFGFAAFVF